LIAVDFIKIPLPPGAVDLTFASDFPRELIANVKSWTPLQFYLLVSLWFWHSSMKPPYHRTNARTGTPATIRRHHDAIRIGSKMAKRVGVNDQGHF